MSVANPPKFPLSVLLRRVTTYYIQIKEAFNARPFHNGLCMRARFFDFVTIAVIE